MLSFYIQRRALSPQAMNPPSIPSSDELWNSSPQEWHQRLLESGSISELSSLRSVLINPPRTDHLFDNTSKLRDLVTFLTSYVEERRVFGSSQPWFVPERILNTRGRAFFEWPDDVVTLKTSTDRYCDPIIERFEGLVTAHQSPPSLFLKRWQANLEQMGIAAISLSQWMSQNPIFARESLLHAASLYNDL
ncbi:uncharacterized protein KD926_010139 [Aspergillus affinis]|uniref:uncharacterized protein n=1 Tax=Aspergillus affinis TaxID=1070780 RepID=UPI0022FE797E|nr:uncharacterized protein KD926_010139 [Aspergillus affinis]KAI9038925.1 hypothetical protein KD926_010139 [Aspergillus affinis]